LEPKELCDLRTCFTENFGIEKVIVNVLANPNINCLIVCGEESEHLVGESIISLAENVDSTMTGLRKIIGSNFPLPYLNETPMTVISRFLKEIKILSLSRKLSTHALPLQEAKLMSHRFLTDLCLVNIALYLKL